MAERHLLLWDGECAFCARSVAWVRARDTAGCFEIVPCKEAPSPPVSDELRAACARAVHVITSDGRVLRAGRAALFVLERVGWGWLARLLALPPFVWIVELFYFIVARNRRLFSKFMFRRRGAGGPS